MEYVDYVVWELSGVCGLRGVGIKWSMWIMWCAN